MTVGKSIRAIQAMTRAVRQYSEPEVDMGNLRLYGSG